MTDDKSTCGPPDPLPNLVELLPEAVYTVSKDRTVTAWNEEAERLTGYSRNEVVGRKCGDGILEHIDEAGRLMCGEQCPLLMAARFGAECKSDLYMRHKDGHRVPVRVKARPIRDRAGELAGMAEVFSDNRATLELIERAGRLERLALLDDLTQAGNRRFSEQAIRQSLDNLHRSGTPFALILLDIDHFKQVNDEYGHQAGDDGLRMVAGTLSANLRSFDFIGRWGGEEFVIVVHNAAIGVAQRVAARLLLLAARSNLDMAGVRLAVTLSAGVTQARPGDTQNSLYQRADQLLYEAKAAGRNRYCSDLGTGGPGTKGRHAA